MARCAADDCNRWRPELLARSIAGVTIDGHWFCSQVCVEAMAKKLLLAAPRWQPGIPAVPPPRLGALLRHRAIISHAELEAALEAQQTSGLKLGAQLCAMEFAKPTEVLKALADQAGVRYMATIDPAHVQDAPGGLPRDAVRALGVVPFSEIDRQRRIKVACTAPIPNAALGALGRLIGATAEPYLVTDTVFARLSNAYGSRTFGHVPVVATTSLADAAARIAALASEGKRTSVTEAYWDPYTWVRVTGTSGCHDVLLMNRHDTEREAA